MNQNLYNFIDSELKAGKSLDQIANALRATGHTAEEMDEIIQEMDKASAAQQTPPVQQNMQTQQAAPQQDIPPQQPNPPQQVTNPPPVTNAPATSTTPAPEAASKPPEKKSFFSKVMAFYNFLFPKEEPPTE